MWRFKQNRRRVELRRGGEDTDEVVDDGETSAMWWSLVEIRRGGGATGEVMDDGGTPAMWWTLVEIRRGGGVEK